ncbi:MAG: hypothetical protein ACFFAU_19655 [Candidatus Hodarchaeota archaeon]
MIDRQFLNYEKDIAIIPNYQQQLVKVVERKMIVFPIHTYSSKKEEEKSLKFLKGFFIIIEYIYDK